MNPQDQRERANEIRTNALKRINDRIDALAGAVDEEVAEKMQEIRQLIARLFTAEHAELDGKIRDALAEQFEIWKYAGRTHRQLLAFASLSLFDRIRWFVFGRLPVEFAEPVSERALARPANFSSEKASQKASEKLH